VSDSSRQTGPDDGGSGHANAPSASTPPGGASRSGEALSKEYFALLDIVKEFDKNLLTVKGWGATGWGHRSRGRRRGRRSTVPGQRAS